MIDTEMYNKAELVNEELYYDFESNQYKLNETLPVINDGDRVKINFKRIISRNEYGRLQDKYREFVESNTDTVFYAKCRRKTKNGFPIIIDLDGVERWSFWTGDLIKLGVVGLD